MDIVNKSLCNNVFRKVLGILKPFANFAKGEFAPSASEDAFKKGLSGGQGQSPSLLLPDKPKFERVLPAGNTLSLAF